LELRSGTFSADQSKNLHLENGFLRIEGLAPGDYSLRLRDGDFHEVSFGSRLESTSKTGLRLQTRLEVGDPTPLQITDVQTQAGSIVVQLANWDRFTRVHIAASRFLPSLPLFELATFVRSEPAWSYCRYPPTAKMARKPGPEWTTLVLNAQRSPARTMVDSAGIAKQQCAPA